MSEHRNPKKTFFNVHRHGMRTWLCTPLRPVAGRMEGGNFSLKNYHPLFFRPDKNEIYNTGSSDSSSGTRSSVHGFFHGKRGEMRLTQDGRILVVPGVLLFIYGAGGAIVAIGKE